MKPYKIKAHQEGLEWLPEYLQTVIEADGIPKNYPKTASEKRFLTEAEANNETISVLRAAGVSDADMEVVDASEMTEKEEKKMVGSNDFFPDVKS